MSATSDIVQPLEAELQTIQSYYPLSVQFVNGSLHILFSGAPNHYGNQAHDILSACCSVPGVLGQAYLIDHDAGCHPQVLVLANERVSEKKDANIPHDQYLRWWQGKDV